MRPLRAFIKAMQLVNDVYELGPQGCLMVTPVMAAEQQGGSSRKFG